MEGVSLLGDSVQNELHFFTFQKARDNDGNQSRPAKNHQKEQQTCRRNMGDAAQSTEDMGFKEPVRSSENQPLAKHDPRRPLELNLTATLMPKEKRNQHSRQSPADLAREERQGSVRTHDHISEQ